MLIISGLGRTGSSLCALLLKEYGYKIGPVHWTKEMNAGMEWGAAYALTEWMWHKFIKLKKNIDLDSPVPGAWWKPKTYREAINSIDKMKKFGKIDLIKDPRITWHPKLITSWYEARNDLKLLITHRDPECVLKSRLKLRVGQQDPKPGRMKNVNMFKLDFCDFLTEVLRIGIPYEIVYFPKFLDEPDDLLKKLNNLGYCQGQKKFKDIFNKIVDKDKVSWEIQV
jgi:hypothetical protein